MSALSAFSWALVSFVFVVCGAYPVGQMLWLEYQPWVGFLSVGGARRSSV